jgi:hypothetical protein
MLTVQRHLQQITEPARSSYKRGYWTAEVFAQLLIGKDESDLGNILKFSFMETLKPRTFRKCFGQYAAGF